MNGLKVQDFHGQQVTENLKDLDECIKYATEMACINPALAYEMVELLFSCIDAPWIEHCVKNTFVGFITPSEKDVYDWFRTNYKRVLGKDYSIVSRKNNPKHIPDFWVSHGTDMIPVECKILDFNKKALKQLKRYMDFYGCRQGIAVAKECTCQLPSNIIFINFHSGRKSGNLEVQV